MTFTLAAADAMSSATCLRGGQSEIFGLAVFQIIKHTGVINAPPVSGNFPGLEHPVSRYIADNERSHYIRNNLYFLFYPCECDVALTTQSPAKSR
jgi:hypothetical protein